MGEPVDARADLYAVGVMLHEMITGKPPFDGDAIIVIAKQVNEAPPPLVSPHGEGAVTPELRALVDALLAKDREQRPADANAAVQLLDRAVASLPMDRAATVFGDTLGVAPSPRPPGVEPSGTMMTSAGTAVPPLRRLAATIDHALEPLAKKTGQPARHLRLALSGIGALLLILLLVIALKPSKKDDDTDVSSRRHASGPATPVPTSPASAMTTTAPTTAKVTPPPTGTVTGTPTATATGTTAPPPATGGGPVKKKGGNSLVNKIKSVFK